MVWPVAVIAQSHRRIRTQEDTPGMLDPVKVFQGGGGDDFGVFGSQGIEGFESHIQVLNLVEEDGNAPFKRKRLVLEFPL